jgi:hypothetical protein
MSFTHDTALSASRARNSSLTPERRKEIARAAVAARWSGRPWRNAVAVLERTIRCRLDSRQAGFCLRRLGEIARRLEKTGP